MNELDEVSRRLPAVLHALMTLMSVPYILLATFFVIVGKVASQRGPWAILDTFLTSLNWTISWGIAILSITFIALVTAGFFEPMRWWATFALAGIISITLGILLFYRGSLPSVGELIFLAPAFLILATTCWILIRHQ